MNNSVKKISSETPLRIKSSFSIENLLLKPDSIKNSDCTKNVSDCSKMLVHHNKTIDISGSSGFVETLDSSCAEDLLDTTSEVASEGSNSMFFVRYLPSKIELECH